jgi:hypothetical protein
MKKFLYLLPFIIFFSCVSSYQLLDRNFKKSNYTRLDLYFSKHNLKFKCKGKIDPILIKGQDTLIFEYICKKIANNILNEDNFDSISLNIVKDSIDIESINNKNIQTLILVVKDFEISRGWLFEVYMNTIPMVSDYLHLKNKFDYYVVNDSINKKVEGKCNVFVKSTLGLPVELWDNLAKETSEGLMLSNAI